VTPAPRARWIRARTVSRPYLVAARIRLFPEQLGESLLAIGRVERHLGVADPYAVCTSRSNCSRAHAGALPHMLPGTAALSWSDAWLGGCEQEIGARPGDGARQGRCDCGARRRGRALHGPGRPLERSGTAARPTGCRTPQELRIAQLAAAGVTDQGGRPAPVLLALDRRLTPLQHVSEVRDQRPIGAARRTRSHRRRLGP
jgi:hypothetical protein